MFSLIETLISIAVFSIFAYAAGLSILAWLNAKLNS